MDCCYFTPLRKAKIQDTGNTKLWQRCGAAVTLIHCRWEYTTVQLVWKKVYQLLTQQNTCLMWAVTLLGI